MVVDGRTDRRSHVEDVVALCAVELGEAVGGSGEKGRAGSVGEGA